MINLSILENLFEISIDDNNIVHLGPSHYLIKLCGAYYSYLIELIEQSCQNIIKLSKACNFKLNQEFTLAFKVQELLRKELSEINCIKEPLLRLGIFNYVY